jgi:hypothetical protein
LLVHVLLALAVPKTLFAMVTGGPLVAEAEPQSPAEPHGPGGA